MNKQTFLLLIVILMLGSSGYVWYRYASTLPQENVRGTEGSFGTRLSELQRLKDLQLDVSLFQDPFFKSLLLPESSAGEKIKEKAKTGRENPFLPF